jgi:hypothetical protein
MKVDTRWLAILAFLAFILAGTPALADSIDLGGFSPDPLFLDEPGTTLPNTLVDVSDGTITIHEDDTMGWWSIYYADDAFLVPEGALTLEFDYTLFLGAGDYDWLVLTIDDSYLTEVGFDNSGSGSPLSLTGHVSLDISSYGGTFVSLVFGLEADGTGDEALTSSAQFSEIDIQTPAAIPTLNEWGMILMAAVMALLTLRAVRRRGC